jgi:hypothetical protein
MFSRQTVGSRKANFMGKIKSLVESDCDLLLRKRYFPDERSCTSQWFGTIRSLN